MSTYDKYQKRYQQSEKGRATKRRYQQSEESKVAHKHYEQSEQGKATFKLRRQRYCLLYPERRKARDAITTVIRNGKLPKAKSLLCYYCSKPAQQYHHWHGYEPEYWLDVIPVCMDCHKKVT